MGNKVCIGITTKNRCKILPKAIQSALDQTHIPKEVVVFDDGSTDGTAELKTSFPQVKWMREEVSIGLLSARNKMMKSTDADFFVSLDDDAWFLKNDEIGLAVDHFERNKKLGAISFDVLQKDTKRFDAVERSKPIPTNVYIGCGHILRLSAVAEAGFYVPFPVKYGHEEKDLCIRMLDQGWNIAFMPGVHVWHDYTQVERNKTEQRRSFIINDLVYPFRRVPLVYLLPVMIKKMRQKLNTKEDDRELAVNAVKTFLRLSPSIFKVGGRVKPSTYRRYRSISKSYLEYIDKHDQNLKHE